LFLGDYFFTVFLQTISLTGHKIKTRELAKFAKKITPDYAE
jgi:hypothetical protein